ncbi:unnamed protein product, partial [Vitis vinifera]|uniref:Uncharacterized protein n=1 Tax=Vitis vinifera TaxID=29760 RepID=D7TQF8_VITVI
MGTIYAGAAAPFCFSEERFLTPFPSSLSPFSLSLFSLPNLGFLPSFYNERKSRYGKRRKKGSWRTNSHRGVKKKLKYFPSLIVDLPPCPPLCKEQTEACKEIFFMKKDEAGLLRLSQYLNRIFLSFSFRLRFFRGSCLHFSCNLGLFYSLLDCCFCALVRCYPL